MGNNKYLLLFRPLIENLRKFFEKLRRPLRNQRGVAMLIAIFSLILMVFLANEVSYDATVEYLVASQQVNRLKAYYAAKAGVEISLLRILIYKKILSAFADQIKGNEAMLDPVWQLPFSWPPMLPDDLSSNDKDNIQQSIKDSTMDGKFVAQISSEGNKIDINDLGAFMPEGKGIRDATKKQILKIFQNQVETNDDFRKKYGGTNFEEVVNNMIDWADEDNESLNGGDEKRYYPDAHSDFIPPNKPYKTVEELRMVAGVTEDFYNLLKDRITVYGTKGINVNYSGADVIKSIDYRITDDVVNKIMQRRNNPQQGGPFKDDNDFYGFLDQQGVRIEPNQRSLIPLFYGPEFNFRITATGLYSNSTREITAITYDYDNVRERYVSWLNQIQSQQTGGSNPQPNSSPAPGAAPTGPPKLQPPKGRPSVVYWREN